MRNLLFTLLMCFFAHSLFAQCHATATFAMAPQGNNLLRLSLNNTTTPVTGPGKFTYYYVSWGDGNATGAINGYNYHNYTSPGTYPILMIEYVVDSSSSLTSLYCTDSLRDTVTVAYSPCATSFTYYITGTTVTFTANTPASSSGMSYTWNFGDGTSGTGSAITHSYTSSGSYSVTLSATQSGTGGCTYTNNQTINITSNSCSGKQANFTITHNGLQLIFNNTSTGAVGTTENYNWFFGDGSSSTAYSPTHTYSASGGYNILLITEWRDSATNALLCTDSITKFDSTYISSASNHISGYIFQDSSSIGLQIDSPQYKVWLISYDSTTNYLTAVDSTIVYGTYFYANPYQFNNELPGTYRIKAQLLNGPTTGTSYVPTYHTSSLMWNTANTIYHVGGTLTGQDIFMQMGTAVTGPGFVGGNVSAGANKGTTANGIPNLNIYLLDVNNKLVASAVTNSNGNFTFTGIPAGTYSVYPEDMNFTTTPISITIGNGQNTVLDVDFSRSESHKTISPVSTGILNIANKIEYAIYPNPATDKVTIQWNSKDVTNAGIIVTDVTGKKVFNTVATTNKDTELNLGGLQKGLYFITIQSDNVESTQKILLQ